MAKEPTRKKISVKTLKLSEQPVGFKFQGVYKGQVLGQPFGRLDNKTGEIVQVQLTSVIMEEGGQRVAYLADAGLKTALVDAMVVEGQYIEVVKLEKAQLTKGRTMNQYDIFSLEG